MRVVHRPPLVFPRFRAVVCVHIAAKRTLSTRRMRNSMTCATWQVFGQGFHQICAVHLRVNSQLRYTILPRDDRCRNKEVTLNLDFAAAECLAHILSYASHTLLQSSAEVNGIGFAFLVGVNDPANLVVVAQFLSIHSASVADSNLQHNVHRQCTSIHINTCLRGLLDLQSDTDFMHITICVLFVSMYVHMCAGIFPMLWQKRKLLLPPASSSTTGSC